MDRVQALKQITPSAENIAVFGPVCEFNPYGVLENPFELVNGAYLFEYSHHGQAAMVALSLHRFSGGNRVHVNALQTINPQKHIQMRQLMQAIEQTAFAMGADVLTLSTQHPAIAAGASRWGARISGAVVSKTLGAH